MRDGGARRRRALAGRAAGPILARGGGITGARRTLDTAARTAAARLALDGYRTITLDEGDYGSGFGGDLAETREEAESTTAAPVKYQDIIHAMDVAVKVGFIDVGLSDPQGLAARPSL